MLTKKFFDDNNRILKGVDATLFLIKKAKLLPTICLENAINDLSIITGQKPIITKSKKAIAAFK